MSNMLAAPTEAESTMSSVGLWSTSLVVSVSGKPGGEAFEGVGCAGGGKSHITGFDLLLSLDSSLMA